MKSQWIVVILAVIICASIITGCTKETSNTADVNTPDKSVEPTSSSDAIVDTNVTPEGIPYPDSKEIIYESEGVQYTETFILFSDLSLPFITYIPENEWSVVQTDSSVRIIHKELGSVDISFLEKGIDQQEAENKFESVLGDTSEFENNEENMPEWAIASLYLWTDPDDETAKCNMTWAILGKHDEQYFYIITCYQENIEGDFPLLQAIFKEWRWNNTNEALGYSLS